MSNFNDQAKTPVMRVLSEERLSLAFRKRLADLSGMIGDDLDILTTQPCCLQILEAYAAWEKAPDNQTETAWRERLQEETGDESTETADWSSAHGLLIAYGFLDIELAGRSAGIQYRISSCGKRALAQLNGTVPLSSAEEEETTSLSEEDVEDLAA